ncbi:hypothetical protein M8J77_001348 [Diaphorina citri]|nr:hypothetical protein M8J77_001348 [Diaphorina citri]
MSNVRTVPQCNTKSYTCFIIGDSHVRRLRTPMEELLPLRCKLETCFQPGAGYEAIAATHTQSPGLVNPQPHDPVVLLCGTNDVGFSKWVNIEKAIIKLINRFQSCHRVILVGVPFRFSDKKSNFHIGCMNSKIRYLVKSKSNISFLDPNKFLKSKGYVKDGIHLNYSGKSKLSRNIVKTIAPDEKAPICHSNVPEEHSFLTVVLDIKDALIDLDDSTFSMEPHRPLIPDIPEFVPDNITMNQTVVRINPSESLLDIPNPNFSDRVYEILSNNKQINKSNYYKLANLSQSFSNAAHSSPLSSM